MALGRTPGRGNRPEKTRTVEWRRWKGVNRTDARPAIGDDEFFWCENALTVGDGAIQILPAAGPSIATIAAGVHSVWGFTLNGNPVLIAINLDGSATQVTPGGVVTAIAPAGTFSGDPHLTIWRASPILFIDPITGYHKWDGAAFTTISAATVGAEIAVFEGHVWIAKERTLLFTAPNTFDDFTAGNGAGSAVITDEAFQGNIQALASALEQLWIIGESAIDALANVTASGSPPNVVTTFSITNIVTNIGSSLPHSVLGYLRALVLMTPFGAYALSGVTPQKISDKLDGLFPQLTLTGDAAVTSAVAVVQSLLVLLYAVSYSGQEAQAGPGPLTLLIGFVQGKWFFAVQRTTLKWLTSLVVNGVPQAWATDGSTLYQCFGAPLTEPVTYKIQGRLNDFGASTSEKAMSKVGLEIQAAQAVNHQTLTIDSEAGSETIAFDLGNQVIWLNNAGEVVTWVNNVGAVVSWISQGLVLGRAVSSQYGHFLGWTLSGTDPPYRIQALAFEVATTREWSTP